MKAEKKIRLIVIAVIILVFIGTLLIRSQMLRQIAIGEAGRNVTLSKGISLFGILNIPSSFLAALLNSFTVLVVAALIRIFAIPRFKNVPGKFQLLLETIVGCFYDSAERRCVNRKRRYKLKQERRQKKMQMREQRKLQKQQQKQMQEGHTFFINSKGEKVKANKKIIVILITLIVLVFIGTLLNSPMPKQETIKEIMQDAVLHEHNKINLFGSLTVNPAFFSALLNSAALLMLAVFIRIFAIPKFKDVPGKFQLLLETAVGYFHDLAKKHCHKHYYILGAYTFGAGLYIFFSTIFELYGIQAINNHGHPMSLPAPISDINAAIAMGFLSYLFILLGGLVSNGFHGVGKALKDFSLPISMSFRLFGALLGGLLVNELVYYWISLSYVLPVIVAVLFTLIHALVQAYVLTLLTSIFFGEVTEKYVKVKKEKKKRKKKLVKIK